jgi:hypothetical protein
MINSSPSQSTASASAAAGLNRSKNFYVYANTSIKEQYFPPVIEPICIDAVFKALRAIEIEEDQIRRVNNRAELEEKCLSPILNSSQITLILPGGNALLLMDDLGPISEKIRTFVEKGGKLVGICAGAIVLAKQMLRYHPYGGCLLITRTERIPDSKLVLPQAGQGPFDLVPLQAKYPFLMTKEGDPNDNPTPVPVHINPPESFPKPLQALFYNGPIFSIQDQSRWTGIVDAYIPDEKEPLIAAWHDFCGEGMIIGFAFHPELPIPPAEAPSPEALHLFKRILNLEKIA